MLVNLFRRNQAVVLFGLPVLLVPLFPEVTSAAAPAGLTPPTRPISLLLSLLPLPHHGWLWTVLGCLMCLGLAIQLAWTLNASELYARRNHLTAMFLLLLLALSPSGLKLDGALLGMPLALWGLRRIWAEQGQQHATGAFFDAGLLVGLATLCYTPYLFLLAVVWSTISVMRPFNWREYLLPAVGAGVMLFMAWGFLHLLAPGAWQLEAGFSAGADRWPLFVAPFWVWPVVAAVVCGLFLLLSVPSFASDYARGVMREKNIRASLIAFFFACAALSLFTWYGGQPLPPVLLALPLATLFSSPVMKAKKLLWPELGAFALLALGLWQRWQ